MSILLTTRFNNETYKQITMYKIKHNIKGCIYGVPQQISPRIPYDSMLVIIEMNNSENKIEGIGLIKNNIHSDKYYNIYEDGNYNRYIYKGKYFIPRELILRYNEKLVEILDYILFKEKTHLKRGSGITSIPEKILKHTKCDNINILNEIKMLFKMIYNSI